ncbi:hypothetical protein [Pseudoduganella umbonata]|uniref:Uncharacterized protein n=1 Tax=Pseudoduganella umbonata TaxID=864828 RepID=A0A4P8HNP1_9BURK|nr:hypothetical protein [Pseudoduganella umbonata]MBB3220038.1 hypothetical protein [Pseudoduganella umbonata]QCP10044.1 hypothetical protein FCL38_06105 [Pseudoduganella umbonata]
MSGSQCSCGTCGKCRGQGEFEVLPFSAGFGGGLNGGYRSEFSAEFGAEFSSESGGFGEFEGPFSEVEEMELAMELLSVASEEELDQFLGGLFKKAWKGIKKVGSVVGKVVKPLGGVLKGVAKTALPFVGGALGSMIPIPGVGTMIGKAAGSALASALEMEAEGMDPEQAELEMARRFVRIAGSAAQNAVDGDGSPAAVRDALLAAMRQHVPSARV